MGGAQGPHIPFPQPQSGTMSQLGGLGTAQGGDSLVLDANYPPPPH